MPAAALPCLASAAAGPAAPLPLALFACLPFVLLLGAVAVAPTLERTRHAWHDNRVQWLVAGTLGLLGGAGHVLLHHETTSIAHALAEYAAFVAMLAALYAACGGIHVTGAFAGFPTTNTGLLAVGAALASVIGTTGASMLLIRPLLRANADRKRKTHVFVFFILIVSNCGGLLLPMGDPPLFIGFLRGVPFFWTAGALIKPWLVANGALLAVFGALDTRIFLRESLMTRGRMMVEVRKVARPLTIHGWPNVAFLLAVPAVCLAGGAWLAPALERAGLGHWGGPVAQLAQAAAFGLVVLGAVRVTPMALHHEARFSWAPIKEVAAVFFGLFLAMVPAMALLRDQADHLALSSAWHYFAATGSLSAVLDNAPTYAAFGELAVARTGAGSWARLAEVAPGILGAISCGAVFCGALSYIGNGPNFMVKAVCENHRVKMPSFFGYLVWSNAVLGPVLLLVAWLCL